MVDDCVANFGICPIGRQFFLGWAKTWPWFAWALGAGSGESLFTGNWELGTGRELTYCPKKEARADAR